MMLRGFSWRGVAFFFVFCAAISAWTWSGVLFKSISIEEHLEYFLSLFQRSLLNYFPAFVLVTIADGLPLRGLARKVALAAALFIGVMLAVQVRCAVSANQTFYVYDSVVLPYCTTFPTWRTYLDFPAAFMSPLTIGAMVMIFIFTRRRDAELVETLHRAQAGELEARRQRIESEIEAMHARVDPDKLLETLRDVRGKYEAGLAEGEAMLDTLIGNLREAAGRPAAEAVGDE